MFHHIRHRLHRHTISFKHAFDGIIWVFRTQPNYLVHMCLSILSIAFGLVFHIKPYEWLTVGVLITMGLVVETINSAIEQVLDCVSLERRDDIKIAKDAAAAAMLLFAFGATCVVGFIFVPYVIYG